MSGYNLDVDKAQEFLPDDHYEKYVKKTIAAAESVFNKTCSGNDFLGWLDLPSKTDLEIDATAKRLRELGEIC
ncbi:glucose-6-phosphate isomerase, partial [bacterium]|nr:glucose-6-phosphate isomerase [bacterium]